MVAVGQTPPLEDSPEPALTAEVDLFLRQVFGHPLTTTGLIQTVAVYRPRPGAFRVLRITPETPRSAYDQFSLMVARARADAILTTGSNLRLEPTGTHLLQGPGTMPETLAAWRRERLGKTSPPHLLVLTRGQDLDLDHPAVKIPARIFVFTGEEAAFSLESRTADRGIEVIGSPDPSPEAAVDFLRRELGAATISVEAGPSVARQLYDPVIIDEVQLSILDLPDPAALPPAMRGPFFLDQRQLEDLFDWSSPFARRTADGVWSFQRLQRRSDY
jgi:riboflavin biosynthesis pyrimidine reductase